MRAWPLALFIGLSLAGCFSGDGDETTSSPTGSASPTTSPTSTTAPPIPNSPPTAQISASVEAGTLPLAVNFTLDGADLDADGLDWTFDADGDGTADAEGDESGLPADVTFTYEAAGLYTATLNVSDGEAFTFANATINVTAALAGETSQSVAGEWTLGTPGCVAMGAPGADQVGTPAKLPYAAGGSPFEGLAWVAFPVTPGTIGEPFHAVFVISTAWIYVEVVFYDADGNPLSAANDALDQGNDGHVRGTVPDGAATGVLYPCDPVPSSVTYGAGPGVA